MYFGKCLRRVKYFQRKVSVVLSRLLLAAIRSVTENILHEAETALRGAIQIQYISRLSYGSKSTQNTLINAK